MYRCLMHMGVVQVSLERLIESSYSRRSQYARSCALTIKKGIKCFNFYKGNCVLANSFHLVPYKPYTFAFLPLTKIEFCLMYIISETFRGTAIADLYRSKTFPLSLHDNHLSPHLVNYGQFVVSRGMIITTKILALHLYVPLLAWVLHVHKQDIWNDQSQVTRAGRAARNMTVIYQWPMQNLYQQELRSTQFGPFIESLKFYSANNLFFQLKNAAKALPLL